MEAEQFSFFPLVVVTLLAVIVPVVIHRVPRLDIPRVVGEILAGILVGHSGLNLIRGDHPWLDFLALFGFAYLMFLSGLEIDFEVLRRGRAPDDRQVSPVRTALLSFALTLAGSFVISTWLAGLGLVRDVILTTLILSTTSLGVVMPVLKERGISRTPLGQHLLVASVVADFGTIVLVSAYIVLLTGQPVLEVLLLLVLIVVTFLVYGVGVLSQRFGAVHRLIDELSGATGQLDARGALALAVVFIALAQGLGTEFILGAFLAGAIVSLLTESGEGSVVRPKLETIGYGFFVPIFFITVGVNFELDVLRAAPQGFLLVPILVVAAFAVKYAASLVYRLVFPWRDTLAIGSLLSSRLSLIIAVSAIGLQRGAITEAFNAAIILVAITTVVLSPLLFNQLVTVRRPAERRRIIVLGSALPQARLLARRLQQRDEEVVLVTSIEHLAEEVEGMDVPVVLADREHLLEGLAEAGAGEARALVSMLEDEHESLRLATEARSRFGVEDVVAMIQGSQLAERFRDAGIEVVEPGLAAVLMLEIIVRHPHSFPLLVDTDLERDVRDVRVTNAALSGVPLRNIPLPGDALIVALMRDGETVIPRGHTEVRRGDLMTLVGSRDAVRAAAAKLRG